MYFCSLSWIYISHVINIFCWTSTKARANLSDTCVSVFQDGKRLFKVLRSSQNNYYLDSKSSTCQEIPVIVAHTLMVNLCFHLEILKPIPATQFLAHYLCSSCVTSTISGIRILLSRLYSLSNGISLYEGNFLKMLPQLFSSKVWIVNTSLPITKPGKTQQGNLVSVHLCSTATNL